MEPMENEVPRRRPVRRRKTKLQIFKEAYLPTILVGLTIVLVIWFIIGGAIRRSHQQQPPETTPPATTEDPVLASRYQEEAKQLLASAAASALNYDYEEALMTLSSFSGTMSDFPELEQAYKTYQSIADNLVSWDDPAKITTLSFHVLIADAGLAYGDGTYGDSYKKNFITVEQCDSILQQLYQNGYVLVDLADVYTERYDEGTGKTTFSVNTLRLPEGKKPLLLVQTQVNYYEYMIDGRKDKKPDGFASRLCVDENGKFYNEMPLTDGTTATGVYDFVPLLESFIAEHPDFSYRDARAVLAVSGYDGIFGYRINSTKLSDAELEAEKADATALVTALQTRGYRIACYSYDNIDYGSKTASQIQADLEKWEKEIAPTLAQAAVDILVYPRESDIAGTEDTYTGSKYNLLFNAGFRYFMGFGSTPYSQIGGQYVRHNRLNITGQYLTNHADWYEGLFDVTLLPGISGGNG